MTTNDTDGFDRLTDIDTAYHNDGSVEGAEAFPQRWADEAEAFRARLMADGRGSLDQAYGTGERQVYDLFLPVHPPRGLAVFVHGGYWMECDKSFFSHLAEGPLARGYAVALPSYTLAPAARIADIVKEIAAFLEHVAEKIAGPITLSGHSAGGHLVTRLAASPSPLSETVRDRIAAVLSISGVHDLRPLIRTQMNATLKLDMDEARAESPALLEPALSVPLTLMVGANELAEFRRHTALLASSWYGLGLPVRSVEVPGLHHYDVIDALTDEKSAMVGVLTPVEREED